MTVTRDGHPMAAAQQARHCDSAFAFAESRACARCTRNPGMVARTPACSPWDPLVI